ncbi:MAG: hypothetical protein Q8R20_02345 [Nanoarchaeota archaeon]|nr:hypothetical protein [Nanoarchaeota archaeon]
MIKYKLMICYNYSMRRKAHLSAIFLVSALFILPLFATYAPSYGAEVVPEEKPTLIDMWITAYSSSEDETDSTPNITAIGTLTRDGIVATNMLPIGTLVRIPQYFGKKVFVVEDRMHPRKRWVLDVWMPSKAEAMEFGSYLTKVEVIKRG